MKPHADGGVTFESVAELNVARAGLRAMQEVSTLARTPLLLSGVRALLERIEKEMRGIKPPISRPTCAAEFLCAAAPVIVSIKGLKQGVFAEQAVEVAATAPESLADFPDLISPMYSEAASIIIEDYTAAKTAGNFYEPNA
jgi:hypothetical protein